MNDLSSSRGEGDQNAAKESNDVASEELKRTESDVAKAQASKNSFMNVYKRKNKDTKFEQVQVESEKVEERSILGKELCSGEKEQKQKTTEHKAKDMSDLVEQPGGGDNDHKQKTTEKAKNRSGLGGQPGDSKKDQNQKTVELKAKDVSDFSKQRGGGKKVDKQKETGAKMMVKAKSSEKKALRNEVSNNPMDNKEDHKMKRKEKRLKVYDDKKKKALRNEVSNNPMDNKGATVAALDADAHQSLAQEYGIKGFPTIKVFVPGKPPIDYQGARDVKPIAEFAVKKIKELLKDRLNGKATGAGGGGGSSEKSEPSSSIELNSANFDELVIKSKDLWVVEFFAPWCGHCKKLAPEWKKAANNLKGKVKLGHVDCDAEKSLMSRFNVQGFPSILVFGADKDSPITYEGARTASAIESFSLEQLEVNVSPPEVVELTGPEVMEEKCSTAAICFVSFLPDILDSKAEGRNRYLEMLLSVADKFKRSPYSFVWVGAGKQEDLEKRVNVGGYGYPALVALNVKKGAYAPLKSAFGFDQIVEFIKEAGRGGKGNLALEGSPLITKTEAWDGQDGQVFEEEEISLEELMDGGDDSESKDEL